MIECQSLPTMWARALNIYFQNSWWVELRIHNGWCRIVSFDQVIFIFSPSFKKTIDPLKDIVLSEVEYLELTFLRVLTPFDIRTLRFQSMKLSLSPDYFCSQCFFGLYIMKIWMSLILLCFFLTLTKLLVFAKSCM